MANAAKHVMTKKGPLASVYYCPFCNPSRPFVVTVPKGRAGAGRGYGMASSSIARAEVVAHIKAQHPEKLQ